MGDRKEKRDKERKREKERKQSENSLRPFTLSVLLSRTNICHHRLLLGGTSQPPRLPLFLSLSLSSSFCLLFFDVIATFILPSSLAFLSFTFATIFYLFFFFRFCCTTYPRHRCSSQRALLFFFYFFGTTEENQHYYNT